MIKTAFTLLIMCLLIMAIIIVCYGIKYLYNELSYRVWKRKKIIEREKRWKELFKKLDKEKNNAGRQKRN